MRGNIKLIAFVVRECGFYYPNSLKVFKTALWPCTWSISENKPCVPEKNVNSLVVRPWALFMSISFNLYLMLLMWQYLYWFLVICCSHNWTLWLVLTQHSRIPSVFLCLCCIPEWSLRCFLICVTPILVLVGCYSPAIPGLHSDTAFV